MPEIGLAMMQRDFDQAVSEHPSTFTWNGQDYIGMRTDIGDAQNLEMAGFMDDVDFSIYVSVNRFTGALPQKGQNITADSTTYKIREVIKTTDGISLLIHCKQVTG